MEVRKTGTTRAAPYAWVILLVVFLASVAAPLNQNKVPPLMPVMMEAFQLSLVQAGLLMSVFAITGFMGECHHICGAVRSIDNVGRFKQRIYFSKP